MRSEAWPAPCCPGAVVIGSDGMAMHPYGAECGDCGRSGVRCFARWDAERGVHVCSRCDPARARTRAQGTAERKRLR